MSKRVCERMKTVLLGSTALLLSMPAWASQVPAPTGPNTTIAPTDTGNPATLGALTSPTQLARRAPLTNVLTWKHWANSLSSATTTNFALGSGYPCLLTAEIPTGAISAQLMFAVQSTTDTYTIQQAVVAPSSSYGIPGGSIGSTSTISGQIAFDTAGNQATAYRLLTFFNGGAYQPPWSGLAASYNGDTGPTASHVYSLLVAGAVASGVGSFAVSSPAEIALLGGDSPIGGLYVSDWNGAGTPGIPANTTETYSGGYIHLSASTTGTIPNGSAIYVSPKPLSSSAFTLTTSGGTNTAGQQYYYTDWAQIPYTPRTDGGETVGEVVSSVGITGGQTISALGGDQHTFTLSAGPNITETGSQALTLTAAGASSVINATGSTQGGVAANYGFRLYLSHAPVGLHIGKTAVAAGYLPANDIVLNVGTTTVQDVVSYGGSLSVGVPYVDLQAAPTTLMPWGTSITFTNVAYAVGGYSTGNPTLTVRSTTNNPILEFRVNATTSGTNTLAYFTTTPSAQNLLAEAVGERPWQILTGKNGYDSINIPGNTTNATALVYGTGCPIYAFKYQTFIPGTQEDDWGDSLTAGNTTWVLGTNFRLIAANAMSSFQHPIEVADFAISGEAERDFLPTAAKEIQASPPGIAYFAFSENYSATPAAMAFADDMNLANLARSLGSKVVIANHVEEQAQTLEEYPISATSTNGTLNTLTPIPITGTGVPVTDTMGILPNPPTVTASFTKYTPVGGIVLSSGSTYTIPAGDEIVANWIQVASAVSNATSFTLSGTNLIACSTFGIVGTGVTAGTTGLGSQGNTAVGAVSPPITLSAGQILQQTPCAVSTFGDATAMNGVIALANNPASGVFVFDLYRALEDPNNEGWFYPGWSTEGQHYGSPAANAYAATLWKNYILGPMTGINLGGAR